MASPIVVVGGRGFIGSALVTALGSMADAVRSDALDRRPQAREVIWVSGCANPRSVCATPDVETLTAAVRERDRWWPQARFTLISSGGTVYDPTGTPPFAESSAVAADSTYGRSRLLMEQALEDRRRPGDIIVRVATVYGPGRKPGHGQGVITQWLDCAARGRPFPWLDHPDSCRDYVHVADVADAFAMLARLPRRPGLLNLGAGHATSLRQIAGIVAEVTGRDPLQTWEGRARTPTSTWLDITRATSLGWQPRVPLAQGIRQMWHQLTACSAMKPKTALAIS